MHCRVLPKIFKMVLSIYVPQEKIFKSHAWKMAIFRAENAFRGKSHPGKWPFSRANSNKDFSNSGWKMAIFQAWIFQIPGGKWPFFQAWIFSNLGWKIPYYMKINMEVFNGLEINTT